MSASSTVTNPPPQRDAAPIPGERLEEILDGLNSCIRYNFRDHDPERDWDTQDFVAYAKALPEVDWARTDDPEGELWLTDGTRLVFAPVYANWPAWQVAE